MMETSQDIVPEKLQHSERMVKEFTFGGMNLI